MEHQMESYPSARYTIQQFLQQTKALLDGELLQLISTLNMMILKNGLKLENPKGMLIDSHLTYISAQLLVTSLCVNLNKEIKMQGLDGVNCLESEKQLENRIYCLKEILTKQIQQHIKKTD